MGQLHDLIIHPVSPDELRARRVQVMQRIRDKTGRFVVLLVSDPTKVIPGTVGPMLHPEDVPYFEELLSSTPEGSDADIVVHSSGGLAEAAERLSKMAKAHFREVRFVVPMLAQSAATILVLLGHRLMMGPSAYLGPIDPQFMKPDGTTIPAQALTQGVEKIIKESEKGKLNPAYIPILGNVSPADLQAADDASKLSRRLVTSGLRQGMFAGRKDAAAKAGRVATALCKHSRWLSHARLITAQQLRDLDLPVEDYAPESLMEEYCTLSSLLLVTMQSNIVKLYETETVDIARRIALIPPLGPPAVPQAVNNVNVDMECAKCHGRIPLQLRLSPEVALEPGRVPFPRTGKFKCPHCNADIDATGVRQQVEAQTGKNAVDWPEPQESAS